MVIPHEIERLIRQESSASVAAKSASCVLAICSTYADSLSELHQTMLLEALCDLTDRPNPKTYEEAQALTPLVNRLRAEGGASLERFHVMELFQAILRAAGTFDRKDCVRLCVLCADWSREAGESGDLEWVVATWAETSGR